MDVLYINGGRIIHLNKKKVEHLKMKLYVKLANHV